MDFQFRRIDQFACPATQRMIPIHYSFIVTPFVVNVNITLILDSRQRTPIPLIQSSSTGPDKDNCVFYYITVGSLQIIVKCTSRDCTRIIRIKITLTHLPSSSGRFLLNVFVKMGERSWDSFREHAVYNNNNLARFSRNRENSIRRHYRTALPSIRSSTTGRRRLIPSLLFALNFRIPRRTWPRSFMLWFPRKRSRAIYSHRD